MSDDYIVEMSNITKTFPGVKALDGVKFHLKAGQVMALLGENGAGKSTLMKILSGVYNRDGGILKIFGKNIEGNLTPKRAHELGIAIIHQELNMCKHLSVAENIFLAKEIVKKNGLLDKEAMNNKAQKILARLRLNINPEEVIGNLSVGQQQMVEISKAIVSNAKILIMDEPTSALTGVEVEELFRIIQELKADGVGIVYISHRLEELQYIVDEVTIMRDGHYISNGKYSEIPMSQIIANMVGREIKVQFPRIEKEVGEVAFEVKNLNAGRLVRNVSFKANRGEILGFAGLMGAGRTETTRVIFGVDPKTSGEIILEGKSLSIKNSIDAIRAGVSLIPEDRKKDGLCTKLSVRENILLPNMDSICSKLGVIDRKKEKSIVKNAVNRFCIKLPNVEINANSLSGGNQQKVVVAKWLATNSKVVIFDEPTRGIDIAAKVEIYNIMNELKRQGIIVIFVSSELTEIMGISDRIVVMCDGKVTANLITKQTNQEEILKYATQFDKKIV